MKKAPELRIKRINVFVSTNLMGFNKESLDKTVDVIQYKDETEGWTDLPIFYENLRVYKSGIERDAY